VISSGSSTRPPRWHEVTALFGGRFDPPHVGHREAVRGLFKNPGIRQVLIIPSAAPPHKPTSAGINDRIEMTRLGFQNLFSDPLPEEIKLDFREIERLHSHPNVPSYSIDTIQELKQTYSQLAFVIGSDQLSQLHTWFRFEELLKLAHWIVLERHSLKKGDAERTIQEWEQSGLAQATQSNTWRLKKGSSFLVLVPTDAPNISSTNIREAIARTGDLPSLTVLPEVARYLKDHKLYGMTGDTNEFKRN
jgi:nicotinate-nucleotide adenylyltransferase